MGIGLVTSVPEIDAGKTDQTGDDETGTSCVVDGIGWMVCPLLNALGGLSDAMFAWLDSVLRLQPLSVNMSDPQNTQFSAWESIRNIANVVLVIAFIIIIFSQLTGMGVTNYGVKKTLPRLIIVALAINTSFYLMAIAVDVTNILGVGLHQIFLALLPDNSAGLDVANVIGSFVTGSAIVVGGATIAIASAGFSLSTLALMALPVIAVAMLALFAAVATLFVRNALIIILIVISPLAFAAYLLPNTQGLFEMAQVIYKHAYVVSNGSRAIWGFQVRFVHHCGRQATPISTCRYIPYGCTPRYASVARKVIWWNRW